MPELPSRNDESAKAARRARREERRLKQRLQNPIRAKAMRAARLTFEPSTKSEHDPQPAKFQIGCSGWYYWHWKGAFYPADLPGHKWFAHYAKNFKTVELNAPFYSWPTVVNVQTWRRQAARRRFIYTVKVNELITHVKKFTGTKTFVQDFYFISDLLGPHMGCFLFQLPPSFHYTTARLNRIITQLDPHHRNVVEFRHKSWWNRTVFSAFKKSNIIFCSTSGPRLPDDLIQTADELYIRFHGTKQWYRHDYSKEELKIWTDRIRASNAKRIWAYFNNDRDCHSIHNAKEFSRQLRRAL